MCIVTSFSLPRKLKYRRQSPWCWWDRSVQNLRAILGFECHYGPLTRWKPSIKGIRFRGKYWWVSLGSSVPVVGDLWLWRWVVVKPVSISSKPYESNASLSKLDVYSPSGLIKEVVIWSSKPSTWYQTGILIPQTICRLMFQSTNWLNQWRRIFFSTCAVDSGFFLLSSFSTAFFLQGCVWGLWL